MTSLTRFRMVALAVVATVALAGCGGGGKGEATADGQVDGRSAAATRTTGVDTMEELAEALDIAVPDGYLRQPDEVGDTGPVDLEKAVNDDGGDDAREVLTRTRFVRGYQRMWSASGDDEIVAYVYQFADQAGAVEYTNRLTADLGAPPDGGTSGHFAVPTIDGAVGFSTSDPTFASSSVTFVKGPYSVQMVVNGATPTGLEAMVTALAEEQYSRL